MHQKKFKEVIIYTDGACSGNPGPGGWAAILQYQDQSREISGFETHTTNNRMELQAAIEALRCLKEKCYVTLYTDSQYVCKGVKDWLPQWRKNQWKSSTKSPIKNQDLWHEIDQLIHQHHVHWHWIEGHSGNPGNERADHLARLAIKNNIHRVE